MKKTNIEMVQINAGTFQMGSPDSEPGHNVYETQHQVTLTQGFYMGKYPVTQEQYKAVMGKNPSKFNKSSGGDDPAKRPVEQVNWYDAIVFCNRLSMAEGLSPAYSIPGYKNTTDPDEWGDIPKGRNEAWNEVEIVPGSKGYRLPTEAQWEYACRAGTTTAYNTGDTMSVNDSPGWYSGNSRGRTHEAGLKPPNAWGLYDMHGNVWELCWDWFVEYESGAQTDPGGAVSGDGPVLRGGGWCYEAWWLRSAKRYFDIPLGRGETIGFRLVRP